MKIVPILFVAPVVLGNAFASVVPVPSTVVPERIPGAKPRNVVFILSDDHRFDAMGFMGHPLAVTPQMDRLADACALEHVELRLVNAMRTGDTLITRQPVLNVGPV